jgi:RNA polymerase sigma-70 factor (ECF subfamily)
MDDSALMAAFYACDETAFVQLVGKWEEALQRFFRRLGWSVEDAEDLTQETFVRVYATKERGSGRYDPQRPFPPWVYQIARSVAVDAHRCGQRRPQTQPFTAEEGKAPSAAQIKLEGDIAECLETLDERERVYIILGHLEPTGMTQAEIAVILGVSNATMSKIKQRALQKLRTCMEQKGYR